METLFVKGVGDLTLRELNEQEFFSYPMKWAAEEGWNPGMTDGSVFYHSEPHAHLGIEYRGNIIGSGSILSYNGLYGFMGLFIIDKSYRNQGIGRVLWEYRRDILKKRLKGSACIGMDGVFDMQEFYHRGGFEFSHRNLRMQGKAIIAPHTNITSWYTNTDFEPLNIFDQQYFGVPRRQFLSLWLNDPNIKTLVIRGNNNIGGYISYRKCGSGFKIGPLFAANPDIAENLLLEVIHQIPGETYFLDIPEINPYAVSLAATYNMQEVFGCARMYLGKAPLIPWNQVYGITTFELG